MQPKLTKSQQEALALITCNGRFGVGAYGGIRNPTANALVRLGLCRFVHERRGSRVVQFIEITQQDV